MRRIPRPYPEIGKHSLQQVIPFPENCRRPNPSEDAEGMVTSQLNSTKDAFPPQHFPPHLLRKLERQKKVNEERKRGRDRERGGLSSYSSGSLWLPIDFVSMATRSRDASILQLHPLRCVCAFLLSHRPLPPTRTPRKREGDCG